MRPALAVVALFIVCATTPAQQRELEQANRSIDGFAPPSPTRTAPAPARTTCVTEQVSPGEYRTECH